MKVICIFLYAFGEILIDVGEVEFSSDCLLLAMTAVICTTGKYFMIEKVMNCKLSKTINYKSSFDPFHDEGDIETDSLLPSISSLDHQLEMDELEVEVGISNVEMINLDGRKPDIVVINTANSIDTHNHQIEQMRKLDLQTKNNSDGHGSEDRSGSGAEDNIESIPALLTFVYILPLQIIIGLIVFMSQEYDDIMYNKESAGYKSVRGGWFWYSRLIINAVFAGIYLAEIYLVGEFSALYMMVFGAIRNVSTLCLSWIVLKYKLTVYGWMGYAIAIIAVSGFQYAKKFDNDQQQEK